MPFGLGWTKSSTFKLLPRSEYGKPFLQFNDSFKLYILAVERIYIRFIINHNASRTSLPNYTQRHLICKPPDKFGILPYIRRLVTRHVPLMFWLYDVLWKIGICLICCLSQTLQGTKHNITPGKWRSLAKYVNFSFFKSVTSRFVHFKTFSLIVIIGCFFSILNHPCSFI